MTRLTPVSLARWETTTRVRLPRSRPARPHRCWDVDGRACAELAWAADPAEISGQYFTERGKRGRYPAVLTDPAVQDQVISIAENLTRHAPTMADPTTLP